MNLRDWKAMSSAEQEDWWDKHKRASQSEPQTERERACDAAQVLAELPELKDLARWLSDIRTEGKHDMAEARTHIQALILTGVIDTLNRRFNCNREE